MCKYKNFYLFVQTYFKLNMLLNINILNYSIFQIYNYLYLYIYIHKYNCAYIYLYNKIITYKRIQQRGNQSIKFSNRS